MSGFFARNFIWSGTGSDNYDYAVEICKGCVKALIRCGWQFDESVNTDIDNINEYGSGNGRCCWFVLKSKSGNGAKLLVYYGYYSRQVPMPQQIGCEGTTYSQWTIGDLCLSMIPAGSSSTFGADPTSEQTPFIPNDATPLSGPCYTSNYINSTAKSSTNGRQYEWTFVSNGEDFVIYNFFSGTNTLRCSYIIGNVIGTLSYPDEDTSSQAKYAVLGLTNGNVISSTNNIISLTSVTNSTATVNEWLSYNKASSSLFLANGSRYVPPSSTSNCQINMLPDYNLGNTSICASYLNGQKRWTPIGVAIANINPATGQTIYGADGFKGYLSTNKFRFVGTDNIVREQLLNDGDFVHFANGIVVPWDATNSIKLTYTNSAIDTSNYDGGDDPF